MKKGAQRKTNGLQDMSKGEYLEYIKKKGNYEKLPFNEAVCCCPRMNCLSNPLIRVDAKFSCPSLPMWF